MGDHIADPITQAEHAARLPVIDLLRGAAALAVVAVHLPFSWNALPTRFDPAGFVPALPPIVMAVTDYGRFGVHLFLVISGFCIHLRVARGGNSATVDFVRFWRRRLTRLYPPYFVALLISLAALVALFGIVGGGRGFPRLFGYESASLFVTDLVQLVTLTQNLTDASDRIGNPPFWTLALEEQLYLLYFLLLFIRRRMGWAATLWSIAAVTLAWRALPLILPGLPTTWLTLGPARWLEWALGAVAVEAFFGRIVLPAWTRDRRVALGAIGLAVAINAPAVSASVPSLSLVSDPAFGVAFFLLVNWSCESGGRVFAQRPLRLLGSVGLFSYSLYLTHEPAMAAAKQIATRAGLESGVVQTIAMLLFRLAVAVLVGYVFYRFVELRAIRASRRSRVPIVPQRVAIP